MKKIMISMGIAILVSTPTIAATDQGYQTGGGAGANRCTEFVDSMRMARQAGGLETDMGRALTSIYAHYLAGFVSAFNATVPEVFDIMAPLQPDSIPNGLIVIESYCEDNPALQFDDGVLHLMESMMPLIER